MACVWLVCGWLWLVVWSSSSLFMACLEAIVEIFFVGMSMP